jgi:SAM-dependent methyltransferase
MQFRFQAWDDIFRKEGRVFHEPFQKFDELVCQFRGYGCSRILDLGCGSGRHVVQFAKQGFQIWGLEFSRTGLKLTNQWLNEEKLSAPLMEADMRGALPIQDEAFDGILSTQVIHHSRLGTIKRTISEIWRILDWGGLVFVTVPARRHAHEDYIEIEPNTFLPSEGSERGLPHHIFSIEELRSVFSDFRIIDASTRGEREVNALLAMKT